VRLLGCAAFVLAAALAACDAPRPPSPRVWTLFDVQQLYAGGAQEDDAIAADAGLPGGIRLGSMLGPDNTLFQHPTLTEKYDSRYLTTEVWTHFDEIWVQPLYIPVTGWEAGSRTPVPGGSWIFGVGPRSAFYSPFWQVIYVNVPEGTTRDTLRSVRDVFDSGYSLHPAAGRTVSLVPPVAELDGRPAGAIPVRGEGWVDGERTAFLDFGGATFRWDANGVIEEIPIYVPVYRSAGGELKRLGITTIAANGPRGSNLLAAPSVDGQARYAAYWRVYLVVIPPPSATALIPLTVFAPPGGTGLHERLKADGFPVIDSYADAVTQALAADPTALAEYEGRVSLNSWGGGDHPPCFDSPDLLPFTMVEPYHCDWLSLQSEIESRFDPSQIIRTDVTVTCPVITLDGVPVMTVGLK
jgi:hypothetical protein